MYLSLPILYPHLSFQSEMIIYQPRPQTWPQWESQILAKQLILLRANRALYNQGDHFDETGSEKRSRNSTSGFVKVIALILQSSLSSFQRTQNHFSTTFLRGDRRICSDFLLTGTTMAAISLSLKLEIVDRFPRLPAAVGIRARGGPVGQKFSAQMGSKSRGFVLAPVNQNVTI